MDGVTRIGVSLEPELLKDFDKLISKKGYVSRSEAIRDLVRDSLAESEWKNDKEYMSGVIVMIYDHEVTGIGEKLTVLQHEKMQNINTSIHVHLDHDRCMEVIIVEGELGHLKELTNEISAIKGVLRCKLTMASRSTGHMHHIGTRG
ncbi:MAG: nickel-responsive transcriptional regulator NikR [Candidatus Methanogranum gryphiswaldense]|jgi:CopG family transcriptional regulator, nickel-responsive regulator|nr:MAG: nickel-responsive transcriptional regulator NikR [Candidatus Methanogranum sp. U3.2.1]